MKAKIIENELGRLDLGLIPKEQWIQLHQISAENSQWVDSYRWFNERKYCGQVLNPCEPQQPWYNPDNEKPSLEIPAERNIFFSYGRFSLPDRCIAYLITNLVGAATEIFLPLRESEALSIFKGPLTEYLNGLDVAPGIEAISRKFLVHKDAALLDLRDTSLPFIALIEQYDCWKGTAPFFKSTVGGRDNEKVYLFTNAIAKIAFEYGFDGVSYMSVRAAKDDINESTCLALFKDITRPCSFDEDLTKKN